ncbi:hypothetical protein FGO68_gene17230 [Halteria grandinella]|uniref:Transmembrane protein n=1 Tax=Halteria grandinella TaxID=5974 RepID=A0A8J8SYS6_HALGN|nr:hypothetical protein FGO68_gene17230 [Halteria grandinella]
MSVMYQNKIRQVNGFCIVIYRFQYNMKPSFNSFTNKSTRVSITLAVSISLIFSALTIGANAASSEPQCTLKGKGSEVAFPSLKQCYIFTKDSCCTSVHDEAIQTKLSKLVSDSCMDNFDELIQYFCLGCYKNEGSYVNMTTKTIRICKTFAARVWSGGNPDTDSLNNPQTTFDNCGLDVGNGTEMSIKIQSIDYKNATAFFNQIKPPFFESFKIDLADDDCYDIARPFLYSALALIGLLAGIITLI